MFIIPGAPGQCPIFQLFVVRAGIGKTGGGLGIDVGYYYALPGAVEIDHDLDGRWVLEIYAVHNHTLELYDASSDTTYLIRGYQRSNFDYDMVFYNNIQYFLQGYEAWEKVFTSEQGAINDFDDENYLQFLSGTQGEFFRSSIDETEPRSTKCNGIMKGTIRYLMLRTTKPSKL